ncbi:MAG: ribonucleoside-diphosphate reductase alpha chain [Actinomycetota bacterium]|nr:ribonucleoside-diphosphate reductase alpha chain [Actinomycetota bacterium]
MALAPEQTGIGIRRHFSTEGVDPYDEVTWERRDARITNYRDGTVAFEQLGVEFPVGWSQNATNIVAQKYFRGTLGTPEREWSLKQVINRVVSTVTAWGRRDGYFVDGAEADAFRDELTTLLLHQRAAFNSPVWFNIGVMGAPQQASACQPYDALVSTPEGLIPIGRLVEQGAVGAKVFDAHGLTQVVAVKANGRKPVLRLHTKAGYQLDVTADHLVWRSSGDASGRFVPAGELRAGDKLEWHRTESFGEGEISRQAVAEAALAGWLQGDGFVGQYQGTNRSLTIEAMTVTPAEKAWVLDAIDTVFPDVHRHERTVVTVDRSLDCRRTRLYGAPLADFVERWDLMTRGVDMVVPEHLFTASLPVVAAYLRSLFQAEGYVSVRPPSAVVGLAMVSQTLVRGIQSLLLRFGIFSRVRFAPDSRADRKGCLVLSIRTAGDRRRFADEIGFVDPAKAAKLEASLELPGLAALPAKRLEVERIEEIGETEVYDIQTESGEYLSGNVRVHNCFILAVEDTMRSILNWYTEEGIIFQGGSGSGVNLSNIRSSYEHLKGGGTASGPVSFMRGADASAGTIKSGGKTRRAAKMVILNADHPDVEDFIWCKAVEERKARVLRDNGFDMDLDGKDSHSTQYQNANNSVRVTDEFMQAVVDDADWHLRAVTTGEPIRTVKARDLFRQIAEAAWECADPGMQFDTTINKWHTASNTGRINGSNPCCFTGDTLVDTSWGLVRIEQLQKTADADQDLPLAWSFDETTGESEFRSIRRAWVAGHTDRLVEVRTAAGLVLRCTPEHRFLTDSDGYVEAQTLAAGQRLRAIDALGTFIDDVVASVDAVVLDAPVPVYDLEIDGTHNFCVASDTDGADHAVVVHNSEYMHLDNSACNLASLNLLRFLNDDGSFDVEGFRAAIRVVFTAQEILVGNADYPTERIADTSRRFRQLGLGYANLGALLMALGVAYDSEAGRAWAGAITALMTGEAYATSARTAARMGPFAGYAQNKEPMNRVLEMHRDEIGVIDTSLAPSPVLAAARDAWDDAVGLAEIYGVRNSQATVLAPTGCLVGGTLVPTERGLVRLRSLGDPEGDQWQDLGIDVATDVGVRTATKFYVNGLEPVVTVDTARGYRIQGTPQHRVKVVDEASGSWAWKRLADVGAGDLVPLALSQLVGDPQRVVLPPLPEAFWTGEHHLHVPRSMTAELAELVGHFMAGGTLHASSLRFRVEEGDFDVVERIERLGKEIFGMAAATERKPDHTEVAFRSVRLILWWEACGFAKHGPEGSEGHAGRGYQAHVPDAVLHSNDPEVYRGFLRGLFESGGRVEGGVPTFETPSPDLARDAQALLLALRYPTARKDGTVRLLNLSYSRRWAHEIGFVGDRKNNQVASGDLKAPSLDNVPLTRELVDRLLPEDDAKPGGGRLRQVLLLELARGRVSRSTAVELHQRTADAELSHLLGFFYDRVASAALGDEELTYDLSVPENVTYVANGFVSHNTIGLMMDCDTTGIEPDLGLCKTKKLVGGGTMSIVNQTVPRALRRLGYGPDQVNDILAYIDEQKSILGAPHLSADHLGVFACSMGDNVIHYLGHVKMMSAVQPWISGAISKTVNVPETMTVDEVEQLHIESWRLGLKALAIYRDNCKVGQPLSSTKTDKAIAEAAAKLIETVVVQQHQPPDRERLPRMRHSKTFSFRVADCHGYVTVGEYDDGRPGEIFLRVAKQGSTLAGIMDAFAISVSHGLQYGVPIRAFVDMYTNMRFEPAGMTDDPDIRFASSLVDYIFRRLAVEYLTHQERADLGILTVGERMQPTLPGVEEQTTPNAIGSEVIPDPVGSVAKAAVAIAKAVPAVVAAPQPQASDAPYCYQCGMVMQRAGACFVCSSCGTTSGCS